VPSFKSDNVSVMAKPLAPIAKSYRVAWKAGLPSCLQARLLKILTRAQRTDAVNKFRMKKRQITLTLKYNKIMVRKLVF